MGTSGFGRGKNMRTCLLVVLLFFSFLSFAQDTLVIDTSPLSLFKASGLYQRELSPDERLQLGVFSANPVRGLFADRPFKVRYPCICSVYRFIHSIDIGRVEKK